MTKETKQKFEIQPLIIIVIAVLAFLTGTLWTRLKQVEKAGKVEEVEQAAQPAGEAQPAAPEFKPEKKEKPEIKFFVMSFCPYGNQAEDGLKPVAELFGDKVSWQPVYIVSDAKQSCELGCANSVYDEERCQQLVDAKRVPDMDTCKGYFPYNDEDTCLKEKCEGLKAGEFDSLHGKQELNQNIREICAWNMGDEANWWDFVDRVNKNCDSNNADDCWQEHAKAAGLDVDAVAKCEKEQGKKLLAEHLDITKKYGVGGSPTVIINEALFQGGRQPEDYKQAVCAGFETAPDECGTVLSETTQAPVGGGCQ